MASERQGTPRTARLPFPQGMRGSGSSACGRQQTGPPYGAAEHRCYRDRLEARHGGGKGPIARTITRTIARRTAARQYSCRCCRYHFASRRSASTTWNWRCRLLSARADRKGRCTQAVGEGQRDPARSVFPPLLLDRPQTGANAHAGHEFLVSSRGIVSDVVVVCICEDRHADWLVRRGPCGAALRSRRCHHRGAWIGGLAPRLRSASGKLAKLAARVFCT